MLNRIQATTDAGALLTLPLQDISEGYVVEEVEGLDPVKATLVSSNFAMMDGAQYQSSRREIRTISLRLGLVPDYEVGNVQMLRARLYQFFMPRSRVLLQFIMDDGTLYEIIGRVESFNTEHFSKDPAVSISIQCFDPDFNGEAVFDFSGQSVLPGGSDTPLLYNGTVETGFVIGFSVESPVSRLSVINRTPDNVVHKMDIVHDLIADDGLTVSTITGEKYVVLDRAVGGLGQQSILYSLSPYSEWLKLYPGINNLRIESEGAVVPWFLVYTIKYGGL